MIPGLFPGHVMGLAKPKLTSLSLFGSADLFTSAAVPGGTIAGDLIVIFGFLSTPPAGYGTVIPNFSDGFAVYYKISDGTDSGADFGQHIALVFRGNIPIKIASV